jgi:hypothetical protein
MVNKPFSLLIWMQLRNVYFENIHFTYPLAMAYHPPTHLLAVPITITNHQPKHPLLPLLAFLLILLHPTQPSRNT